MDIFIDRFQRKSITRNNYFVEDLSDFYFFLPIKNDILPLIIDSRIYFDHYVLNSTIITPASLNH